MKQIILMSIQPKWVAKILNGEKTIEVRKHALKEGDEVQVSGLAPESKCLREIYVEAEWDGKDITVPLVQLQGIEADGQTQQAVDDWHYWVGRGYGF